MNFGLKVIVMALIAFSAEAIAGEENYEITIKDGGDVVEKIKLKDENSDVVISMKAAPNKKFYTGKQKKLNGKQVRPSAIISSPTKLYHFSWARKFSNSKKFVIKGTQIEDNSHWEKKILVRCQGSISSDGASDNNNGNKVDPIWEDWTAGFYADHSGENALIISGNDNEFENAANLLLGQMKKEGYNVVLVDYPNIDNKEIPNDLTRVYSIGHGGPIWIQAETDENGKPILEIATYGLVPQHDNAYIDMETGKIALGRSLAREYQDIDKYLEIFQNKLKENATVALYHCHSATPYPDKCNVEGKKKNECIADYVAKKLQNKNVCVRGENGIGYCELTKEDDLPVYCKPNEGNFECYGGGH